MPITGAASYISTCQSFVSHWTDANAALPAAEPLTLAGNLIEQPLPVTLAIFTTLFGSLQAQRDTVTESLVELEFARGDVATLRTALVTRIGQFIGAVRGNLAGSKYERSLPAQPSVENTQEVLQTAAVRVRKLWEKLNADPATGMALPLKLEGGYELATFSTGVVEQIAPLFLALEEARSQVKLEREERNELQEQLYPLLKAYRQVLPTLFPAGNALVATLPDLTPKPGATPDPVTLTGSYSVAEAAAKLDWTLSSAEAAGTLEHYEIRAVPGPDYLSDDEVVVASILPGAPRMLLTAKFLPQPGLEASFKVYVVLKTGNEAGSDAVMVQRV